jgi:hypothetical protein
MKMNRTRKEEDVGTCSICLLDFHASEDDGVPRLLKCGHSFCTACLTRLLGSSTPAPATTNSEAEPEEAKCLRCPKCRTVTRVLLVDGEAAAGVKGLPRNFDLIDLLSSSSSPVARDHKQPRPTGEALAAAAAVALKCANCSQAAEKFCEQCGGAHLCVSCDGQIHSFLPLRSHVRVASADAPEPRAACEHHPTKKAKMWCNSDCVAVCTVCLVAGPHKGHDAITIEDADERAREAARVELSQVEAAMGEVEAAVEREAAREAGEQKRAREARAAIKRHFDRMRKAVAQRERALGTEVDKWERTRAKNAAKRRAKLAEAQTQLAAAGKALQQQLQQRRRVSWGGSVAACQMARTTAVAVAGMRASGSTIAFASEGTWRQAVASSGRLERGTADTVDIPAVQRTLSLGDQFGSPCGVAVDAAGHIVVADSDSDQVCVWRADDGACLRSFRTLGSEELQLRSPWGVAVEQATGLIVATDYCRHQVHVWRANDGTFVRSFGSRGSGLGQFLYPRGVAVNKKGHVIVADGENHRVQVWRAKDGCFLRSFGSPGSGPGEFQRPTGVAVDAAKGHIIVADSGNHRVQVWRPDGSFIRSFGSQGRGRGQTMYPTGVAVDAARNILVADWGNHRVQVWRPDGSFLRTFGSHGCGPGHFRRPTGVAVDATGHFIVADSGNKRVQVW